MYYFRVARKIVHAVLRSFPFNVQAIGNDIVVTYVLHQEGSMLETDGPGLGYVDIYSSSGQLLVRLEHGSWLNAPWA